MTPPDFSMLPKGYFKCLAADPPWAFKSRTSLASAKNIVGRRDAEKHYPVMPIADIRAMPVRDLVAKDAHLFMWTTGPFLQQTFAVMEEWGFTYSGSGFVWIKMRKRHNASQFMFFDDLMKELFFGLGHTTRKNAEFCLLGRRGKPQRLAKNIAEVIVSPIREHSRKPDEFFDRVERYCEGPRLELFSRQDRPGWTTWGRDVGMFNGATLPTLQVAA